ncbi:DUF4241 domain-containing protein [Nocardia xishanensis]|uniref:DUF4241 domain-containing protein n=1 Tax=Nocardia xishanensis TaxID=238964 RepID=UPI000835C0CB|nr:DUF4241 domain-containing protein [Nocardia xishanensis]
MDQLRLESREYLDGLFTVGRRIGGDPHTPYSWIEIVDVQKVAVIRLPSGRLVVDSPWSTEPPHELALRVPPGTYPVEASWAESPIVVDGYYTEHRECAATRLRIRDEPVVTWELVLGRDEDPSGPRADRAGFEAEEAMGCFADATAWESPTGPFRRFLADAADSGFGRPAPARDTEDLCDGYFELARDEEHRADLLTFGVPEGWAQVWAGRDRDGEIAVIVVPGPVRTSPWD